MLPETVQCNKTCDVAVTLTKEVLKSFVSIRSRNNRSESRDSCKSTSSEKEIENDDEIFDDIVFPVVIPHPSPVYESEADDTHLEDQFKDHAFNLNVQLEVASTFGRVSSLSFNNEYDSEEMAKCITSFGENSTSDLHYSPKIRRSSSPGLRFSRQNPSRRASLMIPYQRDNTMKHTELRSSLSNGFENTKGQKPRKRSWDSRCNNKSS